MYSKCFRQLDLDGNLIGELGGYEIMRALTKREQRMLISSPSLGVIIVNNIDSVCRSVCLSRSFKLLLLFCSSMELSHFWPSVLHVALYKTLFLRFLI